MNKYRKKRAFQDGEMIYAKSGDVQHMLEFYKKLYYDLEPQFLMDEVGLKDQNGVEIYEGDILKSWYERESEENYHSSGCVIWNERRAMHDIDIIDLDAVQERFPIWVLSSDKFEFEVIGNIHENPNLLKNE